MPDSNRNWKGIYFFVKETDWVCHLEEWDTMPHGFDNTLGIVKDSGLVPSTLAWVFFFFLMWQYFGHCQGFRFSAVSSCFSFFFLIYSLCSHDVVFPFLASIHPSITNEQEAFIQRVLEIPFKQRKCRDLITLDTLHTYCDGPEPTPAAHRLNTYSRHRKYL